MESEPTTKMQRAVCGVCATPFSGDPVLRMDLWARAFPTPMQMAINGGEGIECCSQCFPNAKAIALSFREQLVALRRFMWIRIDVHWLSGRRETVLRRDLEGI